MPTQNKSGWDLLDRVAIVPFASTTSKDRMLSSVRPHMREVKPHPPKAKSNIRKFLVSSAERLACMTSYSDIRTQPVGQSSAMLIERQSYVAQPISCLYSRNARR
jgi:hypothetical protein